MAASALARCAFVAAAAVLLVGGARLDERALWGDKGHGMSGRAAATNLPAAMPQFFRSATAQLEYLNPEPDRWRFRNELGMRQMDEAYEYDHFMHMELLTPQELQQEDRFAFLEAQSKAGVREPEDAIGLLYYRILEMTQRLETEFRLWRAAPAGSQRRRFIEQRIINDAGILGHYVADGANPHHTSVHFNGWDDDFPNSRGFTNQQGFHSRFETQFVGGRVNLSDLLPEVDATPRVLQNPRADVEAYLRATNARLERLYELDMQRPFEAGNTSAAHKQFAVERLVAGVEMLRNLWWTAWQRSASPPS
jgi:hypothetical protein